MLKNLRVGWRQLTADPGYGAIVLLGLSLAVASCCLVAQVVYNEVLPDPEVPDPANAVNIEFRGNDPAQDEGWFDQAPFVLASALQPGAAPVSAVARSLDGHDYTVHAGDRSARLGFEFADPGFVDIFGLRASAGDIRAAFARPDAVALTEASARRLFPAGGAIGKTVVVRGHALTVVALVRGREGFAEQDQEAFTSFESPVSRVDEQARTSWGSVQGKVFARVAPGFRPEDVSAAAQAAYLASPAMHDGTAAAPSGGHEQVVRAMPFTRAYLHGGRDGHDRLMQLLALAGGAALMLGLAVANYINLTSVRTLARAREIAVRKTLGASPWRLTVQFMSESVLAAAIAATAGLLIAWWLAPAVGGLLYLRLGDGLFSPPRLLLLAAGALALGVCTGLYPARIAHGVRCVDALAGRSHDEGRIGRGVRRGLTALQFAMALVMASGAGAMLWQNVYVGSLQYGIRSDGLLTVDVPDGYSGHSNDVNARFREALSHEPGVDRLAWSMDVPGRGQAWTQGDYARDPKAPPTRISVMPVDVDFFGVYDVHVLEGRLRAPAAPASAAGGAKPERLVVVDAATSRALGFASPRDAVDQVFFEVGDHGSRDVMRIVAVSSPVRMEPAQVAPRLHMFGLSVHPQDTLTLQGPRMDALRRAVERVWPRFFEDNTLEAVTIPEALGLPYLREQRQAQMALATTGVALLLSGFGVYALAAWTVRRRAREIVVRKLYGAGRGRVARLLVGEFAPLLAVAALAGLPLAAWLAQAWLANFVERTAAAFLALPIALLLLVATTTLAALRHARIAMAMRPGEALRG